MPRPAPKRNRTKPNPQTETQKDDISATSPERGSTLDPRQALRSQTPMTTSYEQAIESSPTGSRPGTGSRPPTRSRGYSSTLSFAGRKGDTSSRIPGTPGYDSSVLSNFRRRPRQQSILQMMQADDGSSELDDDDFLGGLSPQDESTPLNLSRGKSLLVRTEQSPSPSESLPSSGGSRKSRPAEEVLVPESSIESAQDVVEDTPTATPIARVPSSHPSEGTPRAIPFPDILSQTLAPPASSPGLSTNGSVANGPALQDLDNTKQKDPLQLSTAALQNKLLPRRRQRRRKRGPAGDFNVPSDESDEEMHDAASGDDDELSYISSRRRGNRSNKPKPLGNTRAKSNQKQKKAKAKLASGSKPAEPQGPATFGRPRHANGDVDKENEMLSSPGSSPLSSPPDSDVDMSDSESETGSGRRVMSDELRAAIKKFAEVDQWKMEYEDISASEL